MKIYIHSGFGHYVGSTVVVIAENLEDAKKLIRQDLIRMDLDFEEFSIEEHEITANKVVYSVSGDY